MTRPYTALLCNDQEYVAGANGESAPIFISDHQGGDHCCGGETNNNLCVGTSVMAGCPLITIQPAGGRRVLCFERFTTVYSIDRL